MTFIMNLEGHFRSPHSSSASQATHMSGSDDSLCGSFWHGCSNLDSSQANFLLSIASVLP